MSPAILENLRLAATQLRRELELLPPFSEQRRVLHGELERLRGVMARLERA